MEISGLIGITGGIGSGKSVVSRILRLCGERVYDCDTEARRIMESDPAVVGGLRELLGEEAYTPDGRIDRAYVGARLFSDNAIREGVNAIVHTAVREEVIALASEATGRFFCESAILVTAGISRYCSGIWLVTAPELERIERVKRRNGLPAEEIARRMAVQANEFMALPSDKVVEIPNGEDDLILPLIMRLCARGDFEKTTTKI